MVGAWGLEPQTSTVSILSWKPITPSLPCFSAFCLAKNQPKIGGVLTSLTLCSQVMGIMDGCCSPSGQVGQMAGNC